MSNSNEVYTNGAIQSGNEVQLLNKVGFDFHPESSFKSETQAMECIPVSKQRYLTSRNCNVVMNGHYNPHGECDPFASHTECEEDTKPFIDQQDRTSSRLSQMSDNFQATSVASTLVSTIRGSPVINSGDDSVAEDDSEGEGVEPESSKHLLRNDDEEGTPSPKSIRPKPKLPLFRSSPSKKGSDPHSHIQHRPLSRYPQFGSVDSQNGPTKYSWTVLKFICGIILLSLLIATTCIIVGVFLSAPINCDIQRPWWQGTTAYEIFAASFQDTDSDGFGDLKGISERLDYIKNLSIDVIRLNSIFSALDYPLEYEHVIDFFNVDPHIGRLDDFKDLVQNIHDKGMYLIVDMNPTRTSDQHTWAAHWLLHRPGKYENFYVNVSDTEDEPPMEPYQDATVIERTNPHRTFGGHLLLNWSNPLLQNEMENVLEFWLQLGVDGFYMKHLEDIRVKDTKTLTDIIHKWKNILEKYSVNGTKKILMGSLNTMESFEREMSSTEYIDILGLFEVADAGINFSSNKTLEASDEVWNVRKWTTQYPVTTWISWHFGSVETSRLASRVGRKCVMNSIFLLALLPGSMSMFYGDEIGLEDSYDALSNKIYRGGQLTPMQWDSSPNANFTDSSTRPWLPIYPDNQKRNVVYRSKSLNVLKQLLAFKKSSLYPPQHHTHQTSKSVVRSIVAKFQNMEASEPNYRWFHDAQSSLVALEVSYDHSHKFVLFANFGNNILRINGLGNRKDGVQKWNDMEFGRMKIIFATNGESVKSMRLRDALLEPGHSLLCLYVT